MHSKASILEFFSHMEWADARIWTAIQKLGLTEPDEKLHQLLFHSHFTQQAFLQVWEKKEFRMRKVEEFETTEEIRSTAVEFYPATRRLINSTDEPSLHSEIVVPWAKYFARRSETGPAKTTLGETLVQVAMHTQYHRAQINTRIRELGGEPPLVDYIAWLWLDRPEPVW